MYVRALSASSRVAAEKEGVEKVFATQAAARSA